MKCNNPRCIWEGTIGELEDHEVTCRYAMVPCPNECTDISGCLSHVLRQNVGEHLRKDCPNRYTECPYCKMKGRYAELKIHDKLCEKKLIHCPDCNASRPRADMDLHMAHDCPFATTPCRFANIGCPRKLKRKDMLLHEKNTDFHINMVFDSVIHLKDDVQQLKATVVEMKSTVVDLIGKVVRMKDMDVRELQLQAPVTFAVKGFRTKKEMDQKFTSSSFYTSASGYRMAVRVFPNGDGEGRDSFVSVCAPILEGKYDNFLKWPFTGSITFTLLNQLDDNNHCSHTTTLSNEHKAVVGVDWGKPKFIAHSKLGIDLEKKTQYLREDTLYFRVSVEVADFKPWLECTHN